MSYRDLRHVVARLQAAGALIALDEPLDSTRALDAIQQHASASGDAAVLARRVDGAALGVLAGLYARPTRLALALDLPPSDEPAALATTYLEQRREAVDAAFVAPSGAPCKQVVLRGAAANLARLLPPEPLGPWRAVLVCGEPARGSLHLALVRAQVVAPDRLAIYPLAADPAFDWLATSPPAAPVALALGCEPTVTLAAAERRPLGDPYAVASAIAGSGVVVTECEGSELEVPAHAELVLEGHSVGPLAVGEHPAEAWPGFAVRVDIATHRRGALVESWGTGASSAEADLLTRLATAAEGAANPD